MVQGIDVGVKYEFPDRKINEEDRKIADDLKNRGNEEMKNLNFEEAVKIYSRCVPFFGLK